MFNVITCMFLIFFKWGPINFKMVENSFMVNRERAIDYLNTREKLFVFDGFAGWDPKYRIKIRIVCARAYHGNNIFIFTKYSPFYE